MTDSNFVLRLMIGMSLVLLFVLSILLWSQTPQLFEFFNQAFCAH
ncbi:hypothetical protein [Acinetobacter sp. ASP199]|nr:hypothetical protein [Acinetobacter sp. ASP199]